MLKKLLTAATLLILSAAQVPSFAQQTVTIDKVVAVVGNSIILYSEVDETARQLREMRRERGYTSDRNAQIEALEELLQQKLLYNQALIDSVEINPTYAAQQADEYMTELVTRAGSVAQLEAEFHRPIFDIRREITNRFEEQQYAQSMRSQIVEKVSITPGEVERFYRKIDSDSLPIIPIQYVYAQITKLPLSTSEAKLRSRQTVLNLRERIINGSRFDVFARMYSEDGSAIRGGEMDPMPLERLEPPFAKALEKLKVGQISEVVETVYGFHIIELLEKLPGNMYRFRHILVRPQFTDVEMLATNNSLDSLVQKIKADSITFDKAAMEFSDDKYSRNNGGLVSNLELLELYSASDASYATTKHFKDDLEPDDFRALDGLQPGEISKAFQTTDRLQNRLSKVVKLIEIIPSHPANLKEDYLSLEGLALNEKRQAEYLKWLDKKIDGMFIRISPELRIPEEFSNKSWLK